MNKNEHVLIIGGGVAGLAVSLFLKRAGIDSTIFESRASHKEMGAGFLIFPNGVKILQNLGVSGEILSNSTVIRSLHQINQENEEISVMRNYYEKYHGAPMISIARENLLEVLLQKITEEGIKINYNKRLENIEQSKDQVTAIFEDREMAKGNILIGADGAFSNTRTNLFPNQKLEYSGMWGVQGVSSIKDFELTSESLGYHGDNGFYFTLGKCHPTKKKNILWQAMGFSPEKLPSKRLEKATDNEVKEYLISLMEGWKVPQPIFDMIRNTQNVHSRSIFTIGELPSWSRGRVVLIGDALHTVDPAVGQGSSFSLEDAMYLSKMLKEYDYRDAFYYFESNRRPRTKRILDYFKNAQEASEKDIEEFSASYEIKWDEEALIK